jgi:hypothetical protein
MLHPGDERNGYGGLFMGDIEHFARFDARTIRKGGKKYVQYLFNKILPVCPKPRVNFGYMPYV